MSVVRKPAKVNVKLLGILAGIVVLLGAGAVGARYLHKRSVASRALQAGLAAYEQKDWATAAEELKQYLRRRPTDQTDNRHIEIPEKYAEAVLRVRPLEPEAIGAALTAYRRVLGLDPNRAATYDALADLYIELRNFDELAYVARKRQEVAPDDPKAVIWLATTHIAQREFDTAREELEQLVTRIEDQDDATNEYVMACAMLNRLVASRQSASDKVTALAWLDRAVEHAPQSPDARFQRARFLRLSNAAGTAAGRNAALAAARADLEAVAALPDCNPQTRLALCREWLEMGDEQRCLAELAKLEALPEEQLRDAFVSLDEWRLARFLVKADALLRADNAEQAAALADEVVPTLKHDQYRLGILPLATKVYALAQQTAKAQDTLDEYRDLVALRSGRDTPDETTLLLDAFVARSTGRPFRVIELLEPLLDQPVTDKNVYKLLADAYWQTGQGRRAVQIIETRCQTGSQQSDPDLILPLARQKLASGAYAEAIQLAARLGPENDEARLVCLEARFRQAAAQQPKPDEATLESVATELQTLCESQPKNVAAQVLLATLNLQRNRVADAEATLHNAIQNCPDAAPAELLLVQIYLQTERPNEALAVCQAASARPQTTAWPWLASSEIHESLGHSDDARTALQTGLEHAADPATRHELGLRLATFDLLHDARPAGIARLRELANSDRTDVRTRELLLNLPETKADPQAAEQLINELHTIQGESGLLWRVHQAELWLAGETWRDHADETLALLEHCMDADPAWTQPVLLLGELYTRLGESERAEQVYRHTLVGNPAAADVADRLLALLQQQRRFGDARQVLDELQGQTAIRPSQRVRILLGAGDVNRAIEELQLKAASDTADADAHVALAQLIYQQTGDAARALKTLDEAEAAGNHSLGLTYVRAGILRAEGRQDEARKLLDELVAREPAFDTYFMRAAFLANVGEPEQAEQDLIHLTTVEPRAESYLLLGLFYADGGRLDDAVRTWGDGLAAFPDDGALQRRLMMGLLARGQNDDRARGEALLAQLEQANPDDAELLWIRAVLELNTNTPAALQHADELLQRIVDLQPTAVNAHLKRIELARARGDLPAARELVLRALAANPDDPQLTLTRAEIEYTLQDAQTAGTLVRAVLDRDPAQPAALHLLAQMALAGDTPITLAETRTRLEPVATTQPRNPDLTLDYILVLQALGMRTRVDTVLDEMRTETPPANTLPALLALSEYHRQHNETEPGLTRLTEAVRLAPDDSRVLQLRIRWLAQEQRFEDLAAMLGGERPNPPFDIDVLQSGGAALALSDRPAHRELAQRIITDALAAAPLGSDQWFDLVAALYQAGAVEPAIAQYRQALSERPDSPRALNDLAWVLAESRQNYDEALRLANRGLELLPSDAHLLDTRGVILSNLPDRLADARHDLERCAELTRPGSAARARALLKLIRVAVRVDDDAATLRQMREALDIDHRLNVFSPQERQEISDLQAADLGSR